MVACVYEETSDQPHKSPCAPIRVCRYGIVCLFVCSLSPSRQFFVTLPIPVTYINKKKKKRKANISQIRLFSIVFHHLAWCIERCAPVREHARVSDNSLLSETMSLSPNKLQLPTRLDRMTSRTIEQRYPSKPVEKIMYFRFLFHPLHHQSTSHSSNATKTLYSRFCNHFLFFSTFSLISPCVDLVKKKAKKRELRKLQRINFI